MAVFADPEGAVFCVWEPEAHKGARVINEHGALNFNGLATEIWSRPSGSRSVFGWRVLGVGESFQAWAIAAYGDHLEDPNLATGQRIAEMGVPGFEDVVASIEPLRDRRPPTGA